MGGELLRVWHRGSAPRLSETDDPLGAAEEAARETVEVAVEGYRVAPAREQALVNLLAHLHALLRRRCAPPRT